MANYEGMMRSNYFKVVDVEAFRKLTEGISAEDYLEITANDDGTRCFIGSYSPIQFCDENGDDNIDFFYSELSKIIAEDDAAIFTEVGHEKLRYLTAVATVVTRGNVEWLNLEDFSTGKAKEKIGNPKWETEMTY